MTTPNLNLPEIAQNSFNLAPAYNSSMQIVDALFPLVVQSMTVTAPPATVLGDVGKRWIPATGATGAWAGQAGKVALCVGVNLWAFVTPPPYIKARNLADNLEYQYAGGTWNIPIQSVASAATVTPTFTNDVVKITAQAAALNLADPTGTAIDSKCIAIRIKDNGTARAITYGGKYRAIGVTLPATTVISKTVYLKMVYNLEDDKWDVIEVKQQA